MYRNMFDYSHLTDNIIRKDGEGAKQRRSTISAVDFQKERKDIKAQKTSNSAMESTSTTRKTEKENNLPVDPFAQKIINETSRLSDRQRLLIQQTFANVEKDAVRNGLKIFVRLFAEYPRYKLIWPQFRAIPDSSLMNAVELRRHASVYCKGLGKIIESMRDEDELAKQLTRISLAHIKWNVQRNHVIHMIGPVLEVVYECNGYELDSETRAAWTILYQVIANLIEVFRNRALTE